MIEKLLSTWLGSVVRHLLSYAAGFLLAIGLAPDIVSKWQGSTEEIIISLSTLGIAYLLSRINGGKK